MMPGDGGAGLAVKNLELKNAVNNFFQNPFLGHFQKSETGSESMCRFIMASHF